MTLKEAKREDFPLVFPLIESLWSYNHYEKAPTEAVYTDILERKDSFAFLAMEGERCVGFCHGDFFPTLWMCGMTCYLSSLITDQECRGRGIGTAMVQHVRELALERGCRAIILESGLSREKAHRFYEGFGFERSCYGFELVLDPV